MEWWLAHSKQCSDIDHAKLMVEDRNENHEGIPNGNRDVTTRL